MKKFYSLVLMAAALLIGTNAWADATVSTWDDLKTALQAGGEVTLGADIEYDAPVYNSTTNYWDGIWMGSTSESGEAKDAILNMNGKTITIRSTKNGQVLNPFILSKGSLKITGTGKIEVVKASYTVAEGTNVFSVFGAGTANSANNPKGENPFTLLEIGADVTVETANGTVVLVDQLTTSHASINYLPSGQKPAYGTNSYAFGIRVDVKGTLRSVEGTKCYGVKANGSIVKPATIADTAYVAYIHIHPSALLQSNQVTNTGSAAAYASGYAQWLIEGTCDGASGVYASGGKIEINNATVKSGASTYTAPQDKGHAESSGTAIVVNSRNGYPGNVEVTITGDTKAESTSGYAFEEIVNTTDPNKKVESIVIEGGTFQGGTEGAIAISQKTATDNLVEVSGGNVSGTANVGADDLATYLNNQGGTHTTLVQDEKGHTVLVISEGPAPTEAESIADATSTSVKLTKNDTIESGEVVIAELEMTEDTLLIKDGATLKVGRVVLNKKAQIIVEAGAKLIVNGEQGIVAPVASNIILRNEDGKRSIFLFNPAVTSNRHPNAKVELITNSWYNDADHYQWENFGLPTYEEVKSITCEATSAGVVYAELSVYENAAWNSLGYIGGAYTVPTAKLNKPFAAYNIIAYREYHEGGLIEEAPKVVVEGALVGNVDAPLNAYMKWTPFANSYTAEIDGAVLLNMLKTKAQHIDPYFYIAKNVGLGELAWEAIDDEEYENIKPMQAFLFNNKGAFAETNDLEYASMVWAPATSKSNLGQNAPRRAASASETTSKLRVVVTSEQGAWDVVKFRENASNSVCEKYMNADVNIYAMADEKAAILAAENLENTYVGFSTVKGGNFTISFANVAGREFTLVDHETGARVAIAEGNTYEFTAAANSVNDYRFEIVEPAKLPTAIENTEAVKSAKGIYTITGQFVGEMNVWNTLPAGIYVVNGEKRVK